MEITLYQTLKDKGNPDQVEQEGPFKCKTSSAWLGQGYYFWDTHDQLGHWWGTTVHSGKYMLCKAVAILDKSCWDLHGNGKHRLEFEKICEEIIDNRVKTKENLLVHQVIQFFINKGQFKYSSIRALGTGSVGNYTSGDQNLTLRIPFILTNKAVLDVYPPVQICLIEKRALSLKNYHVVFPEEYLDNLV